jgi:hypothetical protein
MPMGSMQVGGMTYFADGSAYSYLKEVHDPGSVNIGWLDSAFPFATGPVEPAFVDRLRQICQEGVNRTRGLHRCNLCAREAAVGMPPPISVQSPTGPFIVGGAEIRVTGRDGIRYAAPDMIIHYVEAHGYRPPESFVQAVLEARE